MARIDRIACLVGWAVDVWQARHLLSSSVGPVPQLQRLCWCVRISLRDMWSSSVACIKRSNSERDGRANRPGRSNHEVEGEGGMPRGTIAILPCPRAVCPIERTGGPWPSQASFTETCSETLAARRASLAAGSGGDATIIPRARQGRRSRDGGGLCVRDVCEIRGIDLGRKSRWGTSGEAGQVSGHGRLVLRT